MKKILCISLIIILLCFMSISFAAVDADGGGGISKTHTHNYSVYKGTVPASCVMRAYNIYKCKYCNAVTYKSYGSKGSHNYKVIYNEIGNCRLKINGVVKKQCTVCGNTQTTTTPWYDCHSWRYMGRFTSYQVPTYSYKCTNCNQIMRLHSPLQK